MLETVWKFISYFTEKGGKASAPVASHSINGPAGSPSSGYRGSEMTNIQFSLRITLNTKGNIMYPSATILANSALTKAVFQFFCLQVYTPGI